MFVCIYMPKNGSKNEPTLMWHEKLGMAKTMMFMTESDCRQLLCARNGFTFPVHLDDDCVPRNPSLFWLHKGPCVLWQFNTWETMESVYSSIESFERYHFSSKEPWSWIFTYLNFPSNCTISCQTHTHTKKKKCTKGYMITFVFLSGFCRIILKADTPRWNIYCSYK